MWTPCWRPPARRGGAPRFWRGDGLGGGGRAARCRLRAARLPCLIEVLYATGLRVSELVTLPASAAEREARMLIVRGKGNKERMVPLTEAAKQAMHDYLALLAAASPQAAGRQTRSRWLFPSFGESGHLTRQ